MRLTDRVYLVVLLAIDRLLGTRLAERELARRKEKMDRYARRVALLEEQLADLNRKLALANVQLCLLYLQQRDLARPGRWLLFDTGDAGESKALDVLIEHLVKPHLATILEEERLEETRYIYRLKPDWEAICAHLSEQRVALEPPVASWLEAKVQAHG